MTHKDDSFAEFMNATAPQPPRWIGDELALAVRKDLEPGWAGLWAKLVGLHLVSGGFSLWICPQFGVGGDDHASRVMRLLMPYGEVACAAGCGAVFSLITALAAGLFLTGDERRVVAASELWVFSALMSLSWGALMLAGGAGASWSFSLVWILAAIVGSQSVFATVRRLALVT